MKRILLGIALTTPLLLTSTLLYSDGLITHSLINNKTNKSEVTYDNNLEFVFEDVNTSHYNTIDAEHDREIYYNYVFTFNNNYELIIENYEYPEDYAWFTIFDDKGTEVFASNVNKPLLGYVNNGYPISDDKMLINFTKTDDDWKDWYTTINTSGEVSELKYLDDYDESKYSTTSNVHMLDDGNFLVAREIGDYFDSKKVVSLVDSNGHVIEESYVESLVDKDIIKFYGLSNNNILALCEKKIYVLDQAGELITELESEYYDQFQDVLQINDEYILATSESYPSGNYQTSGSVYDINTWEKVNEVQYDIERFYGSEKLENGQILIYGVDNRTSYKPLNAWEMYSPEMELIANQDGVGLNSITTDRNYTYDDEHTLLFPYAVNEKLTFMKPCKIGGIYNLNTYVDINDEGKYEWTIDFKLPEDLTDTEVNELLHSVEISDYNTGDIIASAYVHPEYLSIDQNDGKISIPAYIDYSIDGKFKIKYDNINGYTKEDDIFIDPIISIGDFADVNTGSLYDLSSEYNRDLIINQSLLMENGNIILDYSDYLHNHRFTKMIQTSSNGFGLIEFDEGRNDFDSYYDFDFLQLSDGQVLIWDANHGSGDLSDMLTIDIDNSFDDKNGLYKVKHKFSDNENNKSVSDVIDLGDERILIFAKEDDDTLCFTLDYELNINKTDLLLIEGLYGNAHVLPDGNIIAFSNPHTTANDDEWVIIDPSTLELIDSGSIVDGYSDVLSSIEDIHFEYEIDGLGFLFEVETTDSKEHNLFIDYDLNVIETLTSEYGDINISTITKTPNDNYIFTWGSYYELINIDKDTYEISKLFECDFEKYNGDTDDGIIRKIIFKENGSMDIITSSNIWHFRSKSEPTYDDVVNEIVDSLDSSIQSFVEVDDYYSWDNMSIEADVEIEMTFEFNSLIEFSTVGIDYSGYSEVRSVEYSDGHYKIQVHAVDIGYYPDDYSFFCDIDGILVNGYLIENEYRTIYKNDDSSGSLLFILLILAAIGFSLLIVVGSIIAIVIVVMNKNKTNSKAA